MKGFLPRLVLFSIFILFVSIYPVKAAAPAAVVGSGEVSEQDISDWQAAQSCYGADAITSRKAGFMRMFEATILEQVLGGQAARPITREEYSREVARIDAETRAPDILGCIKKYFGDNTDRYERIFVRPILAQRFIHELVKYSPAVQAHAYALRDKISTDVVKGVPFRDISAGSEIKYATATYSLEADTSAPAAAEPWNRWSPYEGAFIEEHLKGLKPGEAQFKPIEDEQNIRFVRLVSVAGKKYYFETLSVAKVSTEEYLKSIPKLPCKVNDKELYDWVSGIKGNPLLAPAEISPGNLVK